MVTTYKKVGVDITSIKKSQSIIGRMITSTHKIQKLAKVTHGFGHYAGIVQIPGNKFLATHTDGVGTKIMIANMLKAGRRPINAKNICSTSTGVSCYWLWTSISWRISYN